MESVKNVNNVCHDCKKDIEINEDVIKNGVYLSYEQNNGQKINIFKCNECYEKNPALTNFQEC